MKRFALLILSLAVSTAGWPAPAPAVEPDPVRIGMVQTLFNDVPPVLISLLQPPFKSMMKEFTGLNGLPGPGGDAYTMAKDIAEDRVHLGVFQGVEFGWVSQKYPDLKPLMIAVSKYHSLKAHLIVKADGGVSGFADLKGQEIGIPFRAREHLNLFAEKYCSQAGQCVPKAYFSRVNKPLSSEAALDDVLSGKAGAAIVDTLAWESYAETHPGRYRKLKSAIDSDPFPTAVVVYRQGFLSDATLAKFRKGMTSANQSEKGRELMTMWKLTGFEPVPPNYGDMVTNIVRAYPAPVAATAVALPGEK